MPPNLHCCLSPLHSPGCGGKDLDGRNHPKHTPEQGLVSLKGAWSPPPQAGASSSIFASCGIAANCVAGGAAKAGMRGEESERMVGREKPRNSGSFSPARVSVCLVGRGKGGKGKLEGGDRPNALFESKKAKLTMSAGFPAPKCHLCVQRSQSGQLQAGSGAHLARRCTAATPSSKSPNEIKNNNNNNNKKLKGPGPASFLAGIVPGRTAQNKQLQSKGFI